jgi:Zn-dependent protease with chaperone function
MLMFAAYVVAFQLIAIFVLTWFLLMFDHQNTVLSNPAGYALKYALPVALATALLFWSSYRGHAESVVKALDVKLVDKRDEARFVGIAENQCTALGVRCPRFGVIEVAAPNAVTVGEGPVRGLIAVTRGLLDQLDDDELAGVLAHEASHIRQGDTKVMAANHALMRTAVLLQTHNILRIEDWRQLIIPIVIPPMLPLMLVSGMVTMASMRIARYARRGLKLARDHIADGEAVRVTQFPEALVSALQKVSGRGSFPGSDDLEAMLFDGQTDRQGGSHPSAADRAVAIGELSGDMMLETRSRRDTRVNGQVRTYKPATPRPAKAERPQRISDADRKKLLLLFFTDREQFNKLQKQDVDACEWREDDKRNMFGLTPKLVLPTAAVSMFVAILYWPVDGDLTKFGQKVGPLALVKMADDMSGGTFCSGPSYPDGKCHTGKKKH